MLKTGGTTDKKSCPGIVDWQSATVGEQQMPVQYKGNAGMQAVPHSAEQSQ